MRKYMVNKTRSGSNMVTLGSAGGTYKTYDAFEVGAKNYNMAIFGKPGSGKSFTLKTLLARETNELGIYSRVIDVEGEFAKVVQSLSGVNLNLSEESSIRINPLAINVSRIPLDEEVKESSNKQDIKNVMEINGRKYIEIVPIEEKIDDAVIFFDLLLRGKYQNEEYNINEKKYIKEALIYVYTHPDACNYTADPSSLFIGNVKKPEPTLSDVYEYLMKNYKEKTELVHVLSKLRQFLRDGSTPIFDGQTFLGDDVDTEQLHSTKLVNFDISNLESSIVRPIAYYCIMIYIWEYFLKNTDISQTKKIVYVDEFWLLQNNEHAVSFIGKLAQRTKKLNAGLRISSIDFVRFLQSVESRHLLKHMYTSVFLKQTVIDSKFIEENYDFTRDELNALFNADLSVGEGIVRQGHSSFLMSHNAH